MKKLLENDKTVIVTDESVRKYVIKIIFQMFKDKFTPEVVFGITRGGLVPGIYISHALGIPFIAINDLTQDLRCEFKNVLIVDEINDSGKTLSELSRNMNRELNVRYAVLIENTASCFTTDYFGTTYNKFEEPEWFVFPWEQLPH